MVIVDPVLLFQVNPDHYTFISFRITQCPTQCCRRRKALGRLPSWGSDARLVLTSSLGSSLDLPSTPKPQTSPHTFGQAVLSSRSQAINTPDGRWWSASQRAPSPAERRRPLWQKERPEQQDVHNCYFRAHSLLLFIILVIRRQVCSQIEATSDVTLFFLGWDHLPFRVGGLARCVWRSKCHRKHEQLEKLRKWK